MKIKELNNELGNADLFLIDQILKNRFNQDMKILDVGCGEGRNMVYFLRNGFNIYGLDTDEASILMARFVAGTLYSQYDKEKLMVGEIKDLNFPPGFFNAILSINVLHFSKKAEDFFAEVSRLINLLGNDGIFFMCMESNFNHIPAEKISEDLYQLENGDIRFLFGEGIEQEMIRRFGIKSIDRNVDLTVNAKKCYSYRVYAKVID